MNTEKKDNRTGMTEGEVTALLPEDRDGEMLFPETEEKAEGETVMQEKNGGAASGEDKKLSDDSVGEESKVPQERSFLDELTELLAQRPDLIERLSNGEGLPREVIAEREKTGVQLHAAYAEYEAKQARAESERMRRENEILRQNTAAAAKAPVRGTAAGGSTEIKGKDPFLEGFLSDD